MELARVRFIGMAFPGVGGGGVLLLVGMVSGSALVGPCGLLSHDVTVVSFSMVSSSMVGLGFVGTWFLLDFLGFFLSFDCLGGGDFFQNFSAGLSSPSDSLTIMGKVALTC